MLFRGDWFAGKEVITQLIRDLLLQNHEFEQKFLSGRTGALRILTDQHFQAILLKNILGKVQNLLQNQRNHFESQKSDERVRLFKSIEAIYAKDSFLGTQR